MNVQQRFRVLVYGDVTLNTIDGSAIWLVSAVEALARAGAAVTVLLKADIVEDRLTKRLADLEGVDVVNPFADELHEGTRTRELTPRNAARRLAHEFGRVNPHVVVVRGMVVCRYVVNNADMAQRLWAYVTDIPRPEPDGTIPQLEDLRTIVERSSRMFAQTEDARSYLESVAPAAAGKTMIMTPMVPVGEEYGARGTTTLGGRAVRLVYSGKMAKAWRTLQMVDLPAKLEESGITAHLTFIGDKVQRDRDDPGWSDSMASAMQRHEDGGRVQFLGGMAREDALRIVAEHDIGLSWRDKVLDGSLEISTKALEYSALGVAPVVNDTAMHRRLFGAEYPLLVTDGASLIRAIARVSADEALLEEARARARDAVRPYLIDAAAGRFKDLLQRYAPNVAARSRATRVLVASHDLKFASDIFTVLGNGNFEVRVDKWDSLHSHDRDVSQRLLDWADVIFCEWAGPNAVWYSRHKRDAQRLIVRFHRFEINGPWMGSLDTSRVDSVVFVSEFFRDTAVAALGWRDVPTCVIPNVVDLRDLERPKLEDAEFHLGILGIVPTLKRLDRAVDLIENLVSEDSRFVLHVRGRAPWDYGWQWKGVGFRDSYWTTFRRLLAPQLRQHVVFEPFGPDVANWLRRVGWVLSPSALESFHLAPVEGMASGAVPLVWDRAGADEVFGAEWVVPDSAAAAERVLDAARQGRWTELSGRARFAATRYDTAIVSEAWSKMFGAAR